MEKLAIFLMIFCAIGTLAYQGIPYLFRHYSKVQEKRMEKATRHLDQMFISTEKHHFLPLFMVMPLSLGLLGFFLLRNPVGLFIGLALGLISPPIIIKQLSLRRRRKFQNQLVDGLMFLSSALRAGMSLNQALEVLVEEMSPPISDEFVLVIRENQMGVVLEDCLVHLKQRMPVADLDLITTAIGIARETGGDLTEIFGQLVYTMREKKKLEDRVKALTVQGRLQGIVMSILPIAFGFFIYFISPSNFQVMVEDSLGRGLLIYAGVSEIVGIIMIRKLSKVEV